MKCWSLCLVGLSILLPCAASAQIVNTLTGFDAEQVGWGGELEARFSVSGGNTEQVALRGNFRLQWQDRRQRLRLLSGARRKSSRGERVAEQSMVHVRHSLRLRPWFGTLLFAQSQQNPLQRLTRRVLLGAGGRCDILRGETVELALGLAHMLEWERTGASPDFDIDQRLSSFLTLAARLADGVSLNGTAFVQPLWAHPVDLRAIALGALRTRVRGPLALVVGVEFQYDARPPEDVDTTDWDVETGLVYSF